MNNLLHIVIYNEGSIINKIEGDTHSVPLQVLRYRTRWSRVAEEGTRAKAPRVESLSHVMAFTLEIRDIVVLQLPLGGWVEMLWLT